MRLTGQDRFVAEMAVAASGSLSLLGHNIMVVGGEGERGLVKRDQISTRRKQNIQEISYDVTNNYELVKTQVGKQVSDSSSDSSSEEDQVRRSSRTRTRRKRRKIDLKSRRKRRKAQSPAEVPDQLISKENIKLEAADEENNELDEKMALLLKVEPTIKVEDYEYQQEDFQEFFSTQAEGEEQEPGQQMDQEEANELLGFLSGPQEKSVEDTLLEEVLREEGEERQALEVGSEAGSESGLEKTVSDLSIISEFNMLR